LNLIWSVWQIGAIFASRFTKSAVLLKENQTIFFMFLERKNLVRQINKATFAARLKRGQLKS
jgi:hypothetical protein